MAEKILVADDDPVLGGLMVDFLEGAGRQVVLARTGAELVSRAQDLRPDLIVADVQMPNVYGSTACHILKMSPELAAIPVIFVSGHPYEKVRRLLPSAANVRFLPKPVSFVELRRLVEELLGRPLRR